MHDTLQRDLARLHAESHVSPLNLAARDLEIEDRRYTLVDVAVSQLCEHCLLRFTHASKQRTQRTSLVNTRRPLSQICQPCQPWPVTRLTALTYNSVNVAKSSKTNSLDHESELGFIKFFRNLPEKDSSTVRVFERPVQSLAFGPKS